MRMLIVEDERSLADTLRESLAAYGFQPVCAYSSDEAWEALWRHPLDLIVLDVMLPEGDEAGYRWAEQMREAGRQKDRAQHPDRKGGDQAKPGRGGEPEKTGRDLEPGPFRPAWLFEQIVIPHRSAASSARLPDSH